MTDPGTSLPGLPQIHKLFLRSTSNSRFHLGFTNVKVLSLIMAESVFIAGMGGLLGCGSAYLVCVFIALGLCP